MDGRTTKFGHTFSVCPIISPYSQLSSTPKSTPTVARDTVRVLSDFPTLTRRPLNAPPSSPTSSPEYRSETVLPPQTDISSSRCCPLIYLDEQLGKVQPQVWQGGLLDFGCEQTKNTFSVEGEPYNNEGCYYIYGSHGHYSSHDDDSTMVDPSSRAQSMCSETGTVLERATSMGSTVPCYATPKPSLSYEYLELYPSDPDSSKNLMPSPIPSANYIARPPRKLLSKSRRSYGLTEPPPVAARSRQISLPIIHMPSVNPTTNPQIPSSVSSRAQSWHASSVYSPSRKPPKPPPEMEKSIFEDYDDEDNVEEKRVSTRFRHLMRRLHCG